MRESFDKQLQALYSRLGEMGGKCESAIALAAKSLETGDKSLASKVSALEEEIDADERYIEQQCLDLLLRQQPVAGDLRRITAAAKMTTDLERIGDQAADIAEIVTFLSEPCAGIGHIREMAIAAIKMVTDSMTAYEKQDVALAKSVMSYDDVVDSYFAGIKHELAALIASDPGRSEAALDLLMIAKYLERIGDHAVNVAEWVVYSVTGAKGV